ncbi:MAG: M3 family oligoendopeptidase [Candidatus Thorarchaeota archaeon]|nr:M3 family oligoendopeptidase [Candidatus Thorarchaeota archaeon]
MTLQEMKWDLSQLVEIDNPDFISERLKAAVKASEEYREKYRGKIRRLTAKQVSQMLEEGDQMMEEFQGYFLYANLMYNADMTQDVAKRLFDNSRNAGMLVQQNTAFVDIELGQLIREKPKIVNGPALGEYRHRLERIARRIPHMLTEEAEQLIIMKDKNGINAWSQLQSDWLATRTFEIEVDGQKKTLPYGEIIGLYQSPDREVRRRANQTVYETLGKDEIVWSSALRAVCSDHMEVCRLRKWPSPLTQSLIDNDVDEETISALMATIEKNVGTYRDYLKLKAKAMGLPKLGNWDIIAPLPNAPEKKYQWEESRRLIVEAYTDFDEEAGKWIEEMYSRRHLDGEVRKGKTSGAFCATWLKGKSAYILQSFNGNMGDVYTSAHELGHALHAYLGTRAQKPSNYEIGACIAETGSIFGELLLTEKMLAKAKSKEERRAILATVCDEFGEAAFQVSTRYWFETLLYEALEKGTYLDGEKVSELWMKARDKMYGDAVEWLPQMKWWWTMKLHFYIPNFRYYNYPYVYAQLFVYAMYRLYKEQGKSFVPKLKKILSAGSSRSPRDLAAEIGFDITSEAFWQKGIDQFKEFVKLFEAAL